MIKHRLIVWTKGGHAIEIHTYLDDDGVKALILNGPRDENGFICFQGLQSDTDTVPIRVLPDEIAGYYTTQFQQQSQIARPMMVPPGAKLPPGAKIIDPRTRH